MIRHGESEANLSKTLQGQLDSELSENGKKQATKLQQLLPELDLVFSSPLSRALETAKIATDSHYAQSIVTDQRLAEMDLGVLEGKSIHSLNDKEEKMWEQLRSNLEFNGHEGEDGQVFADRIIDFMDHLKEFDDKNNQKTIGIFTHYGVIRIILQFMLNTQKYQIENGDVFFLKLNRSNSEWKLVKKLQI